LFFAGIDAEQDIMRITMVFFVVTSCTVGFGVVFMLTNGGPNRASDILTTYLYEQAFKFAKFGYGTTIGVFTFAVTMALALIILWATKREVYEM
jgi:N-acetylglucosamine transport system permease protein